MFLMTQTKSNGASEFSKEEIQQKYEEFAPIYNRAEWINNHLLGVKSIRRRLFAQAVGRVLDVAAGTGGNFAFLPRTCQITAVDLSPAMLAKAHLLSAQLGLNVAFHVMDAEALTFPNHTFDTVLSSLSTCTFPNPVAALREMARVCKPDGQILLLEHGRSSWSLLGHFQDRTARRHYTQLACRWNQEPLDLTAEAGLNIVEAQRYRAGVFHAIKAQPTMESA